MDNPETVVIQGVVLEHDDQAQLRQVAENETAVAVPLEMLLRAAATIDRGWLSKAEGIQ